MIRLLLKPSLGVVLWSIFFVASACADSILSIQPSNTSIAVGSTFAVDVNISNVSDLYAFQFDLTFTPGLLSAISITEGSFLSGGGPATFLPGTINNATGTITFNAGTLIGPISGVNGSGTLVIIDFKALAAGTSPINIANITLLDSTLSSMSSTAANGAAMVSSQVVPEPSSLFLLGTGLLCVFGVIRRRLLH